MTRLRTLYGAGPLNLLVLLASFAIAAAAVVGWFERPRDVSAVLVWFVAAIVLHDLVLLPLYSLLDRIAFGRSRRTAGRARRRTVLSVVNSTPYLRIPALLSGLLLAVFFPVIFGLGSHTELSASGIAERGYLARWLLASGAMFAVSGVAWAVAVGRLHFVASSTSSDRGVGLGLPGREPDLGRITQDGDGARAPGEEQMAPDDDAALPSAPPPPPEETTPSDDAALPPASD